jgi:hypothetical protein
MKGEGILRYLVSGIGILEKLVGALNSAVLLFSRLRCARDRTDMLAKCHRASERALDVYSYLHSLLLLSHV